MSEGGTFRDGFIQGYKAVRGNNVAVLATPAAPATPAGKTPFQVALMMGIEYAKR